MNITANDNATINVYNYQMPTQFCKTCKQVKLLTEFVKDKSKSSGYRSKCKNCHNAYNRKKCITSTISDVIENNNPIN